MNYREWCPEGPSAHRKDGRYDADFNTALTQHYPWLMPCNVWTGELIDDGNANWTEFECLPHGWADSFGLALCDEIEEEYEKLTDEQKKQFYIMQWKEKYGTMRLYLSYYFGNMSAIIRRYETLSAKVCQECGAPATRMTGGWIGFYCDDCCTKMCQSCPNKTCRRAPEIFEDCFHKLGEEEE